MRRSSPAIKWQQRHRVNVYETGCVWQQLLCLLCLLCNRCEFSFCSTASSCQLPDRTNVFPEEKERQTKVNSSKLWTVGELREGSAWPLPAVVGAALGVIPTAAPYWLHAVPAPQQRALGALQQFVWQRQRAHLQGRPELNVTTTVDSNEMK